MPRDGFVIMIGHRMNKAAFPVEDIKAGPQDCVVGELCAVQTETAVRGSVNGFQPQWRRGELTSRSATLNP